MSAGADEVEEQVCNAELVKQPHRTCCLESVRLHIYECRFTAP